MKGTNAAVCSFMLELMKWLLQFALECEPVQDLISLGIFVYHFS